MHHILAVSLALTLGLFLVNLSAAGQSPSSTQQASTVTFAKHVAPILQNRCQACHRRDTFAPMSLVTYEEVRPWARSIKAKVVAREMPPWFIDKKIGVQHFSNDASLTDEEIGTIAAWVDGGALKGDPADMPPPRTFADQGRWDFGSHGEPDLVVNLPKDYLVPASGPDHWPNILIDPKLTEDRYIAGVQIIPTKGYRSVHHIRTSLITPSDDAAHAGEVDSGAASVGDMGVFLNEYAIGKGADAFPDGSGRLIKAGTRINVSFHLHPNGQETPMNIALGLKLHPKGYTPKHAIVSAIIDNFDLDIRPHEANARFDAYHLLTKPTRLLSYQPHMHNRGKAACMEAIHPLPNGNSRIEPINCARFTFNWHLNYVYAEDSAPLLPAGTILHMINWYDNTAANKANPDPDAQLTFGGRTIDEMSGTWLSLYQMTEEEFKKEVENRRARQHTVGSSK